MRLLILGQTAFLGRALIDAAIERGDEVVVAGRTNLDRERLPQIEWIDTTPEDALYRVGGRTFDAVIDLSASLSQRTLGSALALADRTKLYVLLSSTTAYRDFAIPGIDETYPTATLPPDLEERASDFATYGGRLALCEQRVAEALPGRALILRPGLLAGPYDCTDRVSRLLRRIALGGEMLAGGDAHQPVQILDVRDLASFILYRAEIGAPGLINCTGDSVPLGSAMDVAAAAIDATPDFIYTGDEFLARAGMQPMSQLPLWVPQRGFPGFFRIDSSRSRRLGLKPRHLADTFAAAYAYLEATDAGDTDLHLPLGSLPNTVHLPRAAEQRLIADSRRPAAAQHTYQPAESAVA